MVWFMYHHSYRLIVFNTGVFVIPNLFFADELNYPFTDITRYVPDYLINN